MGDAEEPAGFCLHPGPDTVITAFWGVKQQIQRLLCLSVTLIFQVNKVNLLKKENKDFVILNTFLKKDFASLISI